MNNTSDIEYCRLAQEIFTDMYKGIMISEMVTGAMGILPNLFLLSAVSSVTVFPSNLRLLIGHFSFVLLLFILATLIRGVYVFSTKVCSFTITIRTCRFYDILFGATLANIHFSLVALCIERVYATFNYKKYDKARKVPYLGFFLIICGWFAAFWLNGIGTVSTIPNDRFVPFCESNLIANTGFQYMFPLYVGIESLTTLATILVHFYNRHIARNMAINRALYDLSSRFLVDQNVQINAILLPGTGLHFLCHLPAFIFLIPLMWTGGWGLTVPTRAWLVRSTLLWRLLYALIDPLIAFRYNVHLRQHLLNGPVGGLLARLGFDVQKGKNVVNPFSHANVHFDYLDKLWAKARPAGVATADRE